MRARPSDLARYKNGVADFDFTAGGYFGDKGKGQIALVVLCGAILALADRQKVEGFAAHTQDLTGRLAANHPFRSAAPRVQ